MRRIDAIWWIAALTLILSTITSAAAQEPALPPDDHAMVRFVHLSPNTAATSVTLVSTAAGGGSLAPEPFAALQYTQITAYVAVPAGEYDVTLGAATGRGAPAAAAEPRAAAAGAADAEPGETVVQVRLRDGAIEMDTHVGAGTVTFEIHNEGTTAHDFAIEGVFDGTDGPLQPGGSASVRVDLEPGAYRAYCPVDDHAERGMETELTVTEAPGAERGEGETAAPADPDRGVDLTTAVHEESVTFRADRYYTVALVGLSLPREAEDAEREGGFFEWLRGLFGGNAADGDALGLRLQVLHDDPFAIIDSDRARIRLVHAAPGTTGVDLAIAGERGTLARDVAFRDMSRNVDLEAVYTTLEVRPTGSRAVALDLADVDLGVGMVHTIFVVGTPIEVVPLEAVVVSDALVILPAMTPADPLAPATPAVPAPTDPEPAAPPADPGADDEVEPEDATEGRDGG